MASSAPSFPRLTPSYLPASPTARTGGLDLVHYQTLHTLTELVVFLRNLCDYLRAHPKVSFTSYYHRGNSTLTAFLRSPDISAAGWLLSQIALLVLNSLEFPLQSVANHKERGPIMDIVKETLARACQDMNLIVRNSSYFLREPPIVSEGAENKLTPGLGHYHKPPAFQAGSRYGGAD